MGEGRVSEMKSMEPWFVLELITMIEEAKAKVTELGTKARLRMTVEELIEYNQVGARYLTLKEVFKVAVGVDYKGKAR